MRNGIYSSLLNDLSVRFEVTCDYCLKNCHFKDNMTLPKLAKEYFVDPFNITYGFEKVEVHASWECGNHEMCWLLRAGQPRVSKEA